VILRWSAALALAAGMLLALLAFFALPDFLLQFGFRLHPSVVVLAPALGVAAVLLGLDAWRRRGQARLEQALAAQSADLEQLRRQFIQRLDHELKNPLTAIAVQLDNLGTAPGANAGGISDLRAQVDRLAVLTRGLRRLADLETRPLEPERVDLAELLDEVGDLLQRPDRIELDVQQRPWALPPVLGDRELLLLAFRNLVENALNYSQGRWRWRPPGRRPVAGGGDRHRPRHPGGRSAPRAGGAVPGFERARCRRQRLGPGDGRPHHRPPRRVAGFAESAGIGHDRDGGAGPRAPAAG
jgi:signal transduction histidine kinase